jgi:DNA-binding NarL/FixJ family response regulator
MHWWAGNRPQAEATGAEASAVLSEAGDEQALALALSNESQLHMLSGRWQKSIATGTRAAEMARAGDNAAVLAHALTNVGSSIWLTDAHQGEATVTEALTVALAADEVEHACRAYAVRLYHLIDTLRLTEAERVAVEAIEYADRGENLAFLRYLRVEQSMITLARADWQQAERQAEWAIDAQLTTRCPGLVVQGRSRARRGAAGGIELLTQAWELAQRMDEAQRVAPAGAALLEGHWLNGDAALAAKAVDAALPWYEMVRRHGTVAMQVEFGFWLRRAGATVEVDVSDHPYSLLASGQWRQAAQMWQRAGCPYEHALAHMDSDDEGDLLAALRQLDTLGAEPLARHLRRRLKERGVARVPRGPMPSTKDSPAHLTGRQVEVLRLMADGLTNAEIGARLVLSVRTVETHVAAILDKLEVSTRRAAIQRAVELDLLTA